MESENHVAPEFNANLFNCPHCNAYAHQLWCFLYGEKAGFSEDINFGLDSEDCMASHCQHCQKISIWIEKKLIYPKRTVSPKAHRDMPESVLEFYNEAREVAAISPRSAAALLRIAIKKLCESLGEDDSNLNRAIGNLHSRGLPQNVIQSLDTVRIVGNEGGAHEGQINLTGEDNSEIVNQLFLLINFIVEKTISEPKLIKGMFASLPDDKRIAAEERDKDKNAS